MFSFKKNQQEEQDHKKKMRSEDGTFFVGEYAGRKDFLHGLGKLLLFFGLGSHPGMADVLPTGVNPVAGNVSYNQNGRL